MDDKRSTRTTAGIQVKLSHPNFANELVDIVDMSESGMYALNIEGCEVPPIGTEMDIEILGMIDAKGPVIVPSEIARIDEQGFGLKFLKPMPKQ